MRHYQVNLALTIRADSEEEAKKLAAKYEKKGQSDEEIFVEPDGEDAGILRTDRSTPSVLKYAAGDFIWWQEGMGEMGFGTVIQYVADDRLRAEDALAKNEVVVMTNDIAGLTTKSDFTEYTRVRGGYAPVAEETAPKSKAKSKTQKD